jgi:hypothetical protein
VCAETSHTFTPDQNDWGFTGFIGLDVVLNPANGYLHDGRDIILTVRISIQRDDRYSWDSRKETGFVGLKNQGATCYMNSLLQTLFHLPAFRKVMAGTKGRLEAKCCVLLKHAEPCALHAHDCQDCSWTAVSLVSWTAHAFECEHQLTKYNLFAFHPQAVYHMPTLETDDVSSNMPLALQSVFYKVHMHAAWRLGKGGQGIGWRAKCGWSGAASSRLGLHPWVWQWTGIMVAVAVSSRHPAMVPAWRSATTEEGQKVQGSAAPHSTTASRPAAMG